MSRRYDSRTTIFSPDACTLVPSGPTGGRGAVLALVLPMLALSVGLAALALATNARVERPLSLLAHLIS